MLPFGNIRDKIATIHAFVALFALDTYSRQEGVFEAGYPAFLSMKNEVAAIGYEESMELGFVFVRFAAATMTATYIFMTHTEGRSGQIGCQRINQRVNTLRGDPGGLVQARRPAGDREQTMTA